MDYEVKIDPSCPEPKVIILTAEMTEEVGILVKRLMGGSPSVLSGFKDGRVEILEPDDLLRVYTCAGKVFAVSRHGEYRLRLRLYEVEQRLDPDIFVRISNSEIVNLKNVRSFDLSISGTVFIRMCDGTTTYASRRFVSKIKKILGI